MFGAVPDFKDQVVVFIFVVVCGLLGFGAGYIVGRADGSGVMAQLACKQSAGDSISAMEKCVNNLTQGRLP